MITNIDNYYLPNACDRCADVVCEYLQNTSIDIVSFYFAVVPSTYFALSYEQLAKALSIQHDIHTVTW